MLEIIKSLSEDALFKSSKYLIPPYHVAFVADGARRFGRRYNIPVQENHEVGLQKAMWDIIDWCLEIGIREYSVLMFSFGNYHRPEEEVRHWVVVLRIWLKKCITDWEVFKEKGVRFNIFGKSKLLPDDVAAMCALLMLLTKDNMKLLVTFAMGYTGKHEMSLVSRDIMMFVRKGLLTVDQITQQLFDDCLLTYNCSKPDLFIRTAGHKRLSNFLTWQAVDSTVYFCKELWPAFSKTALMKAVLYYRLCGKKTNYLERAFEQIDESQSFVRDFIQRERSADLIRFIANDLTASRVDSLIKHYQLSRENIYEGVYRLYFSKEGKLL